MDHVSDTDLVKHLRQEVSESRRVAVEAHLAACAACRSRYDGLRGTWEHLGEWTVAAEGHDLRSRVLAAAEMQRARLPAPSMPRRWLGWSWRAAAAIVVGIVLGHGVGRWAAPPRLAPQPEPQPLVAQPDPQTVSDSLHLDVWASGSPAGLADTFFTVPSEPAAAAAKESSG